MAIITATKFRPRLKSDSIFLNFYFLYFKHSGCLKQLHFLDITNY